jgi:hypothetical protein
LLKMDREVTRFRSSGRMSCRLFELFTLSDMLRTPSDLPPLRDGRILQYHLRSDGRSLF